MQVHSQDLSHSDIERLIGRADPIIIEAGANDASDTEEFVRRYAGALVYCFECEPRAIEKWKWRMLRVPGGERAGLHEVALDVTPGVKQFHRSGGTPPGHSGAWDKSGSLAAPTGHLAYSPWCEFSETLEVQCERLDTYLIWELHDRVDWIRLDVQGAELRVLSGATETLKRTRYVQAECHAQAQMYEGAPTEDEMVAFMKERGFVALGRFADDILFSRDA